MRDTYTEIKSSQKGVDNLAALEAAHRHSSSSLCEDVLTLEREVSFFTSSYTLRNHRQLSTHSKNVFFDKISLLLWNTFLMLPPLTLEP